MDKKHLVYSLLKKVPRGKVTTYSELAKAAGTHPRAVAVFMKHNQDVINIPCYKAVRSDGRVGGYSAAGGVKKKISLLKKDGIEVANGRIDTKKYVHKF